MVIIGITGGVGAGKSFILDHLEQQYGARILRTDDVAKELYEPGQKLNQRLQEELPESCFLPDGNVNRPELARLIYQDPRILEEVNALVHPMVMEAVLDAIALARGEDVAYFVIESALLYDSDLEELCDSKWYIYTSEEMRRDRLRETRGYSDEKITSIMENQLSEEEFRKKSDVVIDNNGTKMQGITQVDHAMERLEHGI